MGDDDPLEGYGLRKVRLEDRDTFRSCFSACRTPLSDYTFANTFVWRDSIHLGWQLIHDCLCVFANGDGGLTMLFPPIGPGDSVAALTESLEICRAYNDRAGLRHLTRIEYISQDFVDRFQGFGLEAMSGDYVYETARLIDLQGSDLASKRQARNRFARRYQARTEPYQPRHAADCLRLLGLWQGQTERHDDVIQSSVRIKRCKELAATAEALAHAPELGLAGMVLYAGDDLAGFTFGELLGDGQTCSVLIEKTDRQYAGSAQYIFSEFCRQYWSRAKWCNVGDDWDVPSLAWTKDSYRPAYRLPKWLARPVAAPTTTTAGAPNAAEAAVGSRLGVRVLAP